MTFYRDRQVQSYRFFLILLLLFLFLCGLGAHRLQTARMKQLFLAQNQAVASSLLKDRVPEEIIAKALTETDAAQEGKDLLEAMGFTGRTPTRLLPLPAACAWQDFFVLLIFTALFSVLLLGGTHVFLKKREELYGQATRVILGFIEGDFSHRLPQIKEGPVNQLFAAADRLATTLQSRNEAEVKTGEFLKNTISDISHQLKTPLAALFMYHEIISGEPDQADTVREYEIKTGLALERMKRLIESLLKITRLDAHSIVFHKEACPVKELIGHAVRDLTTRAAQEGKRILPEEAGEETLVCDVQWTAEALANLVKNALDHTGPGGEIRLSFERTPAMLRLCVSDNGTGIAPEDIHHIFKRFYRSGNSSPPGVGLGLPLTKAIVEGQGGMILVESRPGEGASFTLSLPF